MLELLKVNRVYGSEQVMRPHGTKNIKSRSIHSLSLQEKSYSIGSLSRRFIPDIIKPKFLKQYDRWFIMRDHDYLKTIQSSYLSGCV